MHTHFHSFSKNTTTCHTKLSSRKWGGGATFLAVAILLALLSTPKLQAQCTPAKIDCEDISIDICANDGSSGGCDQCSDTPANCHQVKFEVWLKVDNTGLANGTYCLDYTQLTVNTKLTVDGAEYGIPFSRINRTLSKHCSEGFDWDCYYFPSEISGEAYLDIQAGAGAGCSFGLPDLEITILGGKGSLYLFTVVADAWLDETLTLVCNGLIYSTEESIGFPDLGSDGLFTCSDNPSEDSNNTISCTPSPSQEATILASGLSTSADFAILLNEVDLGSHPDYHDCLVQLRADDDIASDHYLDFTLLVTVTEDMIEPTIVEDGQDLDIEWERKEFVNGGGQTVYLFYVRLAATGAIDHGLYDLFRLRIYPPVFISGGGDACLNFGKGRVRSGTLVCDLLGHVNDFENGNSDCTTFGDSPDECANDFSVTVTGITPGGCDGTLQVEVTFGFTTGASIDVDALRLRLDFEGAGVEVTGASLGSAVDCVAGNPAVCDTSYASDCFEFDGNSFTMCFQEGSNGPLTLHRSQPITIDLTTASGCIDGVLFREAEISLDGGTFEMCIPSSDHLISSNLPLCIPVVAGEITDELDEAVDNVDVLIEDNPASACEKNLINGCSGYASCVCGYDDYIITPSHNQNHLNGVSTWDLLLIQKHILGIEYFTSLEQRIAADANWSGDISVADITNIRKVILGIEVIFDNDMTPNDDSWRFYPETYTLSDPGPTNELPIFVEDITVSVTSMGNTPSNLDFKAVKIGDVNSTHIANACRPAARPAEEAANAGEYPLGLTMPTARSGEYITVPLVNEGKDNLEGLQAAFRFDPAALEFVGASLGDAEGISPGCFGLKEAKQGIVRMVWLSPDLRDLNWKPGQALCHFTFRAKRAVSNGEALLTLDNDVLAAQAYAPGKRIFDLTLPQTVEAAHRDRAAETVFSVFCQPNPTAGDATLRVEIPEAADKMRVAVFSAFGQRLFFRQMDLPAGRTDIALPEAAQWAPGIYTWRVWGKTGKQEGKLIKH